MTQHFSDTNTVERVKARYAALAAFMHPSAGGSQADYDAMEQEYIAVLKTLDGYIEPASPDNGNKERQYKFDETIEKGLAEKIGALLALKMAGVRIALIGTWIWTKGDTKPFAAVLKSAPHSMRYSGDKESWYFHFGHYQKRGRKTASFSSMAARYGYKEFSSEA